MVSIKITEGSAEKTLKSDLDIVDRVYEMCQKSKKKPQITQVGKTKCDNLQLNGKSSFVDTSLIGNFLENIEVTKLVEVNGALDSSHPTMFAAPRLCLSENFQDKMAYAYEDIHSEEILVQKSETSDYSFNALVKLWLEGKMPNLKVMEFHVDNTVEGDQMEMDVLHRLLPMVEGRSRVPMNEFVAPESGRIIDCRQGRDVQRHDGKVGTIVRKPSYFAFVAWN